MDLSARPMIYQTKSEAVYAELRRQILDGTIPPGAALNQDRLAVEFGVSTTPLREAMRRLESEGLVKLSAHKEIVVSAVHANDLLAIYEVREELDVLAVRLTAIRHSDAEAALIRAERDALPIPADDPLRANRRFHEAIYSACHNAILIEELDRLWDRSDRHRRLLKDVARASGVVQEHLSLADAVLERDADRAASLMRGHVKAGLRMIQAAVEASP